MKKISFFTKKDVGMGRLLFISLVLVLGWTQSATAARLDSWISQQRIMAEEQILANISPADGRPGAVLASPSRRDPDYYYHWVRDAALVMDIWMRQLEGRITLKSDRLESEQLIWDFVEFTKINQASPSISYLGEPKYYVDGQAYLGPWGRPQNDGPALRASLFIRFANHLLLSGGEGVVGRALWPVIAKDLNYVGQQITQPSFDLWEEVKGDHFYTRLTMRAALRSGATLAQRLGDNAGAAWLQTQADIVESLLSQHVDHGRQLIVENINRVEGANYKSGFDTATILAVLHTREQAIVSWFDPRLENTVRLLEHRFHEIYPINKNYPALGVAFGRYSEDVYYNGNPWFLTTLAVAEFYYLRGEIAKGDQYMERVRFHVARDGHMSEQMDRHSGYMLSAADLTWSYAAFLTAVAARDVALSKRK